MAPFASQKTHPECVRRYLWCERASGTNQQGKHREIGWVFGVRPLRKSIAMLEAALIIYPPFLHHSIPLIAQLLTLSLYYRLVVYLTLVLPAPVAFQL